MAFSRFASPGSSAEREGRAVGRRRTNQRRAAHHHRADGVRRIFERDAGSRVPKLWGSRVWSMTTTVRSSSSSQMLRYGPAVDLHAPAPALVIMS